MIQTLAAASMVAVLMPNTFPSCSKSAAERRDSTPAGRFSQQKHFDGRALRKCAYFNLSLWERSARERRVRVQVLPNLVTLTLPSPQRERVIFPFSEVPFHPHAA